MAIPQTHPNLMSTGQATQLPPDPAAEQLAEGLADVVQLTRAHPESSLCWALLAEDALASGAEGSDVSGYAFARTGYHRGLDLLRRCGWRGSGPVPWEHEPNQGFLRALWALAVAADRIGDDEEAQRCAQFLRDSSETAWQQLAGSGN